MSAGEAEQTITARNKATLEQARTQAAVAWKLANLIAVAYHDPKKFPGKEEAFPGLFRDDTVQEPKQTDWRLLEVRMAAYAQAKNAQLQKQSFSTRVEKKRRDKQ